MFALGSRFGVAFEESAYLAGSSAIDTYFVDLGKIAVVFVGHNCSIAAFENSRSLAGIADMLMAQRSFAGKSAAVGRELGRTAADLVGTEAFAAAARLPVVAPVAADIALVAAVAELRG